MAAPDTDETRYMAGHRQAEAPSLSSPSQPDETQPMEEPAPHSHDGKDEAHSETSDTDALGPRIAPHPSEEGDSSTHTSWQISNRMDKAGAEQNRQCLETHEAHPLVDAPVTDEDIMVDLIQRAKRSATPHIPTTRKSIATRAAKKHKYRSEKRYE